MIDQDSLNKEMPETEKNNLFVTTLSKIRWEDYEDKLIIHTPKEFSFQENLSYLKRSPNECLFEIVDDKIYRAISAGNETLLVEISAKTETMLIVRFLGGTAPNEKRARAEAALYISQWFDLDTDLLPFYELAKKEPFLHKPANHFFGLRNIGIPDLFEALSWGILGQQINLTYAYTLKRRLVERFGKQIEHDGKKYWLFPEPNVIANLTADDLADMKMTVKKREYLISVAQLLDRGELTKEGLLTAKDVKEAEKMLTKIRGIGPWTANYVLMRCLRFPAAFPIDDAGLHNSMKLIMETEKNLRKMRFLNYLQLGKIGSLMRLSICGDCFINYCPFFNSRQIFVFRYIFVISLMM